MNELKNTLIKVFEQDYINIEIIVVDNASDDGTERMVKNDFPNIKYLKLVKNIGATGYNQGFEITSGKYVLVLDDDSYPLQYTLSKAVSIMENDEEIGIGALNVFNTRYNITETDCFENFAYSFIGCGVLISKKVFDKIGYYNKNYFLYHNEMDMSARSFDAGFKIMYLNSCKIIHNQSPLSRGDTISDPLTSEFRYFNMLLSYSIFLILNFSLYYVIKEEAKWLLNRLFICFKYPYLNTFFLGVVSLVGKLPKLLKERKVLNIEVQKYYYNKIPFIERDFFPKYKRK